MTIEFRCAGCHAVLRVKDESAGKQAKCPICARSLEVPQVAVQSAGDSQRTSRPLRSLFSGLPLESSGEQPVISDNPYQSPAADATPRPRDDDSGFVVNSTKLDFSRLINQSWAIYKSRMGLATFGFWFPFILVQVVAYGTGYYGALMMANLPERGVFYFFVAHVANTLFGIFLGLGIANLTINIAGARKARFTDVFSCGSKLVPVVAAGLMYILVCVLGFLVLVVPGMIAMFMFSQTSYLIIDKNVSAMESLSVSKTVTDGNKWTLFRVAIFSMGLPILLGALTFGVGVIVALPYVYVLWAVAYLTMTGQPIALRKGFVDGV